MKGLFHENGKLSLARIMLIVVFFSMILFWHLSVFRQIWMPDYVQNNIHTVFMTVLSYAGLVKFKKPLSDRIDGSAAHGDADAKP